MTFAGSLGNPERSPMTQRDSGGYSERELSHSASHFHFPEHVHFASTKRGVIFMDLRRDRYFGIGVDDARRLAKLLPGFPAPASTADSEADPLYDDCVRLATSLCDAGLLAPGQSDTARPVSVSIDLAGPLLTASDELRETHGANTGDAVRFILCLLRAKLQLRCTSIDRIVRSVRRRKDRASRAGYVFDRSLCIALSDRFDQVKPYIYQRLDQCLLQSLTLLHFLAQFGVFPTWVIGVKTDPWAAHSWIQEGDLLLNARPDEVSEFVPIFSV